MTMELETNDFRLHEISDSDTDSAFSTLDIPSSSRDISEDMDKCKYNIRNQIKCSPVHNVSEENVNLKLNINDETRGSLLFQLPKLSGHCKLNNYTEIGNLSIKSPSEGSDSGFYASNESENSSMSDTFVVKNNDVNHLPENIDSCEDFNSSTKDKLVDIYKEKGNEICLNYRTEDSLASYPLEGDDSCKLNLSPKTENIFVCDLSKEGNYGHSLVDHLPENDVDCDNLSKQSDDEHHLLTLSYEERPFLCNACQKRFLTQLQLQQHNIHVHKENIFYCSICNQDFFNRSDFYEHTCITSHLEEDQLSEEEIIETGKNFCEICNKTVSRLKSHLRKHEREKFVCGTCQKKFTSELKLKRHFAKIHKEKTFVCSICNKSFLHLLSLNMHIRLHESPFDCDVCHKKFLIESKLEKHSRVHKRRLSTKRLVCSSTRVTSDKHSSTKNKLQRHVATRLPKSLVCHICKKEFSSKFVLKKHLNYHVSSKCFMCHICGKRFLTEIHLNSHVSIHSTAKPFVCDVCGKSYARQDLLNDHVVCHTSNKPFACEMCGSNFFTKRQLNKHIPTHSEKRSYVCDTCGKTCSSKSRLNLHALSHSSIKPFACDICGQKFVLKAALNKHIFIHAKNKPFACDKCDGKFGTKASLNRHILRKHTDTKPFVCNVCDEAFCTKEELNRHSRKHNAGDAYICDYCEKRFCSKWELKRHVDFHNKVKSFTCNTCSKAFVSRSDLNRHIKTHDRKRYECLDCSEGFTHIKLLRQHMKAHAVSSTASTGT